MCVLRYIVYLLPINQSTNPSNAYYWTMIKCVSGVCVLGHPSVLCVCVVLPLRSSEGETQVVNAG